MRLAAESGNDDTAQLLASVVDVLDVKTGTVRLRADADKAGTMALDARGTRTVQVGRGADGARVPGGPRVRRPRLVRRLRPRPGPAPAPRPRAVRAGLSGLRRRLHARFCESCGHDSTAHAPAADPARSRRLPRVDDLAGRGAMPTRPGSTRSAGRRARRDPLAFPQYGPARRSCCPATG